MKNSFLFNLSAWWQASTRCPCCGARIRFNWWWVADVDTYFYCRKCGVKLVEVSFVAPAALAALAVGSLYNLYQDAGVARTDVSGMLLCRAVWYLVLIALARVLLLFVLFQCKFAHKIAAHKAKPKPKPQAQPKQDEDLWWEPFITQ